MDITELCLAKLKASQIGTHSLLTTPLSLCINNLIDAANFSSLLKLIHVTAYVILFVKMLHRESQGSKLGIYVLSQAKAVSLLLKRTLCSQHGSGNSVSSREKI